METSIPGFRRVAKAIPLAAILFMAAPADAGDAFVKGGIIFQPQDLDFEGRWRAAFGSDYPVNFAETFYAGFEVQTSVYRQDVTEGGPTATIIPLNGFVNVKYKSGNLGARPFAGGGLGTVGDVTFVSSSTDWSANFGYHLLGGVELGKLVVELQVQGPFDSEAGDTEFTIYVGFVF